MNKRYLTTSQLIELYVPLFTKRNVTIAIIYKKLPYIKMGRKRYFDIESVEKWLKDEQTINKKTDYTTLSDWRQPYASR